MAQLRAELKRAFLRDIYRYSTDGGIALYDSIDQNQRRAVTALKGGNLIVGTSGGGTSVSFRTPAFAQELTPEEDLALSEEFFSIYTDARSSLLLQGNSSPDDQTTFNSMMNDDRMQTIRTVQQDYTTMRWPARY